jgi:hypothetical protein
MYILRNSLIIEVDFKPDWLVETSFYQYVRRVKGNMTHLVHFGKVES